MASKTLRISGGLVYTRTPGNGWSPVVHFGSTRNAINILTGAFRIICMSQREQSVYMEVE